jgi:hypothetical protein
LAVDDLSRCGHLLPTHQRRSYRDRRYIPLSKNIAFHKLIAKTVLLLVVAHTMFHFFNYWKTPEITLAR